MEDDGFNRWGSGPDPIAPREAINHPMTAEEEKRLLDQIGKVIRKFQAGGMAITYMPIRR